MQVFFSLCVHACIQGGWSSWLPWRESQAVIRGPTWELGSKRELGKAVNSQTAELSLQSH